MTRCKTRWYVTTGKDDVERLAGIDHTPEEEIQCKDGVVPLCHEGWSYWSDGEFSGKSFTGEKPSIDKCPISKGARDMIGAAHGSDSGFPRKEILDTLVKAIDVQEVTEHPLGGGGYYAGKRVIEYDVELPAGKKEKLFASTMGYFEGYMFEIERTLSDAKKNFKR